MLEPATGGNGGSVWPTARAEDSESCGNHPGAQDSLNAVSRGFWPTASARDWKDTDGMATEAVNPDGSHRNRLDHLPRVAMSFWPTAKVSTGEYSYSRGDKMKPVPNLEGAAGAFWPTAATQEHRNTRARSAKSGASLDHTAKSFQLSPPDPKTPDGQESSLDSRDSRQLCQYRQWLCTQLHTEWSPELKWRLNPLFAAWLMGWPPFWALPAPICSESPATASSGSAPPTPSLNFSPGS